MTEKKKKTIMLTITEYCNLSCTYCYEQNKSLKEMRFETAVEILKRELTVNDGYDSCEIQFFGGEPFLNFDLLKKTCDYLWEQEWPKQFICFATTNGTLVHGEIQEWLLKNRDRFTCGLSLDGIKKAHDINRCNSFDDIDIDFFRTTWPNQFVKMTISPESLPFLSESVIYLHGLGFTIDNNLAYGVDWSRPELLNQFEEQLRKLADYYIAHPAIEPCRLLGLHIENINTQERIPRWCGAGKGLKAYDAEGDLYPCQMFAPLSMDKERAIQASTLDFMNIDMEDPACKTCKIYNVCPTCYGHNYSTTGDISQRDKVLCEYTKASILATSYLWANRIIRYSINELSISKQQYVQLSIAVKTIQECMR